MSRYKIYVDRLCCERDRLKQIADKGVADNEDCIRLSALNKVNTLAVHCDTAGILLMAIKRDCVLQDFTPEEIKVCQPIMNDLHQLYEEETK